MSDNGTSSTNSAFNIPLIPGPLIHQPLVHSRQSETLLFNDIIEEKSLAIRNKLIEFLKVAPYSKFNTEFNNFLSRTDSIIQENSHVLRPTYHTDNIPVVSEPTLSLFAPLTVGNSNDTPSVSNTVGNSNDTPSVSNTVGNSNDTPSVPNTVGNSNETPSVRNIVGNSNDTPSVPNTVGNSNDTPNVPNTVGNSNDTPSVPNTVDNQFTANLSILQPRIEPTPTTSNSLMPALYNTVNESQNNPNQNANQLNIRPNVANVEKYLFKWSANIISNESNTKVFISITGSLLNEDRVTVAEKTHNAGTLIYRNNKNFVKTTKGLYRLTGGVSSGSPDNLYHSCLKINGIPTTWKAILKKVPEGEQNVIMDFTLKTPAKSNKIINTSFTRSGKLYNKRIDNTNQEETLQLSPSTSDDSEDEPELFGHSNPLLERIHDEISRKRMHTHLVNEIIKRRQLMN